MAEVINLTPHAVTILGTGNKEIAVFPPSGRTAVLKEEIEIATPIALNQDVKIPVSIVHHGSTEGLPEPSAGVLCLVSRLTALANPQRDDLLFPAGEVRSGTGRIIGCRFLGRVSIPV